MSTSSNRISAVQECGWFETIKQNVSTFGGRVYSVLDFTDSITKGVGNVSTLLKGVVKYIDLGKLIHEKVGGNATDLENMQKVKSAASDARMVIGFIQLPGFVKRLVDSCSELKGRVTALFANEYEQWKMNELLDISWNLLDGERTSEETPFYNVLAPVLGVTTIEEAVEKLADQLDGKKTYLSLNQLEDAKQIFSRSDSQAFGEDNLYSEAHFNALHDVGDFQRWKSYRDTNGLSSTVRTYEAICKKQNEWAILKIVRTVTQVIVNACLTINFGVLRPIVFADKHKLDVDLPMSGSDAKKATTWLMGIKNFASLIGNGIAAFLIGVEIREIQNEQRRHQESQAILATFDGHEADSVMGYSRRIDQKISDLIGRGIKIGGDICKSFSSVMSMAGSGSREALVITGAVEVTIGLGGLVRDTYLSRQKANERPS